MLKLPHRPLAVVAVGIVAGSSAVFAPSHAAAATACDALTTSIHEVVNPTTKASLLTPYAREATGAAANFGFTDDLGTPIKASLDAASGTVAIHRLYNADTGDFDLATEAGVPQLVASGYSDEGTRFYALGSASGCGIAVNRLSLNGIHRYSADASEVSGLTAAGWTNEGAAFYAVAGDADTVSATTTPDTGSDAFTLAVMPDTQQLTSSGTGDTRLKDETTWLANNASSLNLKFVAQVGDIWNWGWLVPAQQQKATAAMAVLQNAGIPYQNAVGNHDTAVVGWNNVSGSTGYGGGPYALNPECPTKLGSAQCVSRLLARRTDAINNAFPASKMGKVVGQFESGKIDNQYSEFTAGGKTWMVLQLELYPRAAAVDWAKGVVASHPHDNVIVVTHAYLDPSGSIRSNKEYGDTAPTTLWSEFISQYANIKFVFSGHIGSGASRTDTGVHGNTVASFLQNDELDSSGNPVRLVTIDPSAGTVSSRVYDPKTGSNLSKFATTTTAMSYVS